MQQHPQMMQMQMAQGQQLQQQQQPQMGQNNPLLDLYLCANLHMKEQSPSGIEQVAVETLLRMIHKMYETPFAWQFIDKPRGGASAIVYHSRPINPRSPWPSDGIRYASTSETTTTINHQLQSGGSIMIEKTTTSQGFYPPSDPGLPLPKDTRELLLARYRIRWRIISPNIGNPNLFFVYWGRDETNARRAPQGWEAEVIRKYPLPHIQEPPQFPLRPAQMQGQQQQQQQQGPQGQQQQQQQQPLRPLPPNMQQIQAASRAGQSSTPPPQQMQMQQQPTSMHARGPSQPPQMQPPTASSLSLQARVPQQQQVQAPIQPHLRARPLGFSFPAQFDDPYEMLTERSWAGLRYERNHAFISPVFDPTTTTELLTSWKAPASIDIDQIKAQIASLDSDISKLKAKTLPSKTLDASYDALIQPLPSMISISEMRDGAMQAYNLRRQQAEQEQFAKDEEERKKREVQEAELRSKQMAEHAKFVEAQKAREEEERKAREAEEQAQRERIEQEAQHLQQQQQEQEQTGESEGQSQQDQINGSGEETIQDPMDFDINNFANMNGDMDDLLSTNLLQGDYGATQQEGGESNDQNYADDEFLFSGFANNQYEDNMEQTMLDFDFFSQNNNNGMGEMQ